MNSVQANRVSYLGTYACMSLKDMMEASERPTIHGICETYYKQNAHMFKEL